MANTDVYQLMQRATLVGWERETDSGAGDAIGTNGGRLHFPGAVLNAPALTEDYGHKDFQPLSSGPDPQIVIKTKEEFEVEFEHLLSEIFAGADEFFSLSMGTIDPITGVVTFDQPLRTFTTEWGHKGVNPFFLRLEHCKVDSVSLTFRPDDVIMARTKVMARKLTKAAVEIDCQGGGGTNLTDVALTTNPGAHNVHVTYNFRTVPGGALIPVIVREFDLTWTNNLERIFSDTQEFAASHLMEGKRRWTFNVTTAKQDDQLWDISEADPSSDAGKVDLEVIIDQPSGFYMSMRFPTCVLAEHSADLGQDITHVSESFAGMVIGTPVIDMGK